MRFSIVIVGFLAFSLTGCALHELNDSIGDSADQLMGVYTAPLLASAPAPSGCQKRDEKCRQLDEFEASGYQLVRAKKITWTKFVNGFYAKRIEFFPSSNDGPNTRELISYQRALAEQMDLGKLTEAQWTYLIDKKYAELQARAIGK